MLSRPRVPWHQRLKDTWTRVRSAPPVPPNVEYDYTRIPLWGHYAGGFNVFGPYQRPILDATGGGALYARQLGPYHPNITLPQQFTPVSLTGDGSELHGQFTVLPLVDVSTNTPPGSEVVSVSTQNGVTNIQLGNSNP